MTDRGDRLTYLSSPIVKGCNPRLGSRRQRGPTPCLDLHESTAWARRLPDATIAARSAYVGVSCGTLVVFDKKYEEMLFDQKLPLCLSSHPPYPGRFPKLELSGISSLSQASPVRMDRNDDGRRFIIWNKRKDMISHVPGVRSARVAQTKLLVEVRSSVVPRSAAEDLRRRWSITGHEVAW